MNENRGLGSINSVLGDLFARKGWQKRLHMHSVFDFWNKAVVNRNIFNDRCIDL